MSKKRAILRGLRVGIAVLTLAALVWLGYRRGHRDGYDAATPPPAAAAGQLKIVTYPISDIVVPLAEYGLTPCPPQGPGGSTGPGVDFDPLIDLIVSTIDTETWRESGTGEGEIMPFPVNLSLVISQTQRVHEQIADLLQQLRTLNVTVEAREIIPLLQSRAAYGNEGEPHTLRVLPRNAKGDAATARLFREAVHNLIALWGAPTFRGTEFDDQFPNWSNGKQIAVWPRGEGLAYVAVQDGNAQQQLVAGWRRSEK
jgi:hypothetical protein